MIQIIKQRDNRKMLFFEPKITVESVQELFVNLEKYIGKIAPDELYNLHYTICECEDDEKKARIFKKQNVIPFDIDGIDVSKVEEYIEVVIDAIGKINPSDVAIVNSGRGLHFLIGTTHTITDKAYFKETKNFYNLICKRINRALMSADLPGHTDTAIWAPGHTLRLPGTMNIKKPELGWKDLDFEGECTLISRVINNIPDLTVEKLATDNVFKKDDHMKIKPRHSGGNYTVERDGVMQCPFMQYAVENQEDLTERLWWHMISIAAHMPEGHDLVHEFSKEHPKYSPEETHQKYETALEYGPRLCDTISKDFDGCQECPFRGTCVSPISLRTEKYIATRDTGFREMKQTKVGESEFGEPIFKQVPGKIIYEDLVKYFDELYSYISVAGVIYTYNGKHYEKMKDIYIDAFAEEHVNPSPTNNQCGEFRKKLARNNLRPEDFLETSIFKRMNLQNGVLCLREEPKILEHSPKFGFIGIQSYEYDEKAECPIFDRFLDEVTLGRRDLQAILMEFAGYALSSMECVYAKALILLGEGQNGKSTYLETLQEMVGDNYYSALTMGDLAKEQQRAQLRGKLFNVSEETPTTTLVDSSMFKNVVSGGPVSVKVVYQEPITIRPTAKIMMAANELPRSVDTTTGFMRRLLIVPFDAEFKQGVNRDVGIKKKIFKEKSGILNKILKGYKDLTSNEGFSESIISDEILEGYKEDTDATLKFFREELEVLDKNSAYESEFSDIYREFITFKQDEGINYNIDKSKFSKGLAKLIPDYKLRSYRKGKANKTMLRGVVLKRTLVDVDEPGDSDF